MLRARAEIDAGTRETRGGTRGRGIFAAAHARAMLIYLRDVRTPRPRSLLNLNAKGRGNWAIRVYVRAIPRTIINIVCIY